MSRAISSSSSKNSQTSNTASRFTTANKKRSSSRDGSLTSNMHIKTEDTVTTRGGLGAIQSTRESTGRQIHDRTYYIGVFQSKISELQSEIQRIKHETDSYSEDNQQYFSLKKTAEELSQQIEDARNEFEDYNMARMNSFCDVKEVKKEIDDLHAHNQQLELNIEEIFLDKQKKEERIQQLEYELSCADRFSENMNEISTIDSRLNQIRKQLSGSSVKQEALSLIDQIYELELTHDQLLTTSLNDDDQQIDEFLSSYGETHDQIMNDMNKTQKSNLNFLEIITQSLLQGSSRYEIQNQKPDNTLIILIEQHRKLKQDYMKLETLDEKMKHELEELNIKYKKMKEDLEIFNDLETLKRKAEKRKQQLTIDKSNMIKHKQITQIEIQNLQSQLDTMQKQLQDHETHQQLVGLDKKFQTISQTLFTLDESLASENMQTQYEQIKRQALELVYAHNRWLIQQLKKV